MKYITKREEKSINYLEDRRWQEWPNNSPERFLFPSLSS